MSIYPPSPDMTGGGQAPEQSTTALTSEIYSEYANSFCSVAYADSYFASHYRPAYATQWQALSADQKAQLLIQATADIEQYKFVESQSIPRFHWFVDPTALPGRSRLLVLNPTNQPIKYNYYQALQFPRNIDYKSDGTIFIPPHIQMAECEQAIYRLNFDETILSNARQGLSINSAKVGGISIYQHVGSGGDNLAPSALSFIKPYLKFSRRMRRS